MILILSTPTDPDTEGVIDWLAEAKTLFLRLNEEDLISGKIDFFYNPEDEEVSYFMQEDNLPNDKFSRALNDHLFLV